MTVAHLEAQMGVSEFRDWQRYWMDEPWGAYRDNLHAGLIAAASMAPHVRKGKKAPTAQDFMLRSASDAASDRRANTGKQIQMLKALAKRKPTNG